MLSAFITLWRKVDKNGTEFVLAIIPLGVMSKCLMSELVAFLLNVAIKRLTIKLSVNELPLLVQGQSRTLLAIVVYWIVFMIGVPSVKPVIEDVKPGSIAAIANLNQNGTKIY